MAVLAQLILLCLDNLANLADMLVTCWTRCAFKGWTEYLNLRSEWWFGRLLKRFSHTPTVKCFKTTAGAATLLVWIFGFLIRSWKGLRSVEYFDGSSGYQERTFLWTCCVRPCSSLQNVWFLCCVNPNSIFFKSWKYQFVSLCWRGESFGNQVTMLWRLRS